MLLNLWSLGHFVQWTFIGRYLLTNWWVSPFRSDGKCSNSTCLSNSWRKRGTTKSPTSWSTPSALRSVRVCVMTRRRWINSSRKASNSRRGSEPIRDAFGTISPRARAARRRGASGVRGFSAMEKSPFCSAASMANCAISFARTSGWLGASVSVRLSVHVPTALQPAVPRWCRARCPRRRRQHMADPLGDGAEVAEEGHVDFGGAQQVEQVVHEQLVGFLQRAEAQRRPRFARGRSWRTPCSGPRPAAGAPRRP